MLRFFRSFFRPNSNVDISETVYSIDLKFEVRIVLDHVPFQIEFQVIRINRFRDIDIGSLPEKKTEKTYLFEGANYSRARTTRGRALFQGRGPRCANYSRARTNRGRELFGLLGYMIAAMYSLEARNRSRDLWYPIII